LTFITKLYRELVKDSSSFEAKSKLILITGHSTMDALQKYLRDIDAELPEDYSDFLK
ncbi:site-specific integrase, partial [Tamlana haliotis]